MLEFSCLISGDDPTKIFLIKIAQTESVNALKKAIKDENIDLFGRVGVRTFNLWKACFPIDESLEENLRNLTSAKPLLPTDRLSKVFSLDMEDTHLHIVVECPPSQGGDPQTILNRRDETGYIDNEYDNDPKRVERRKLSHSLDDINIPHNFLGYHRQFWGVPLNPTFTTLPSNANTMNLDGVGESSSERDLEGDVLPGEPFLDVGEKLLVRAEYIRVFDAVKKVHEERHNTRLAVITGQPGIGKTYWILYALRRCLGEKQPIVWYQTGHCYLFSEQGVNIINPIVYQSVGKYTWCLVDSADAETLPVFIYSPAKMFFPIYVTSPQESGWDKLHKLRMPVVITMNPWTWPEIEKASKLYPERELSDIRERFHKTCPSARACFLWDSIDIEQFYWNIESYIDSIATLAKFSELVNNAEFLRMDHFFHKLCIVHRFDPDDMLSYAIVNPITPSVSHQLRDRFRKLDRKEFTYWMRHFTQIPAAHGMMGVLFEAYFQQAFAQRIKIVAKPMFRTQDRRSRWHAVFGDFSKNPKLHQACPDDTGSDISLDITSGGSIVYPVEKSDNTFAVEEGKYYLPETDNEVAIDSFIVHDGHLYLFQFASGREHGIKSGIMDLPDRFSGLPDQDKWHLIFVVPERLDRFTCPHANFDILPKMYTAQVTVGTE